MESGISPANVPQFGGKVLTPGQMLDIVSEWSGRRADCSCQEKRC
jgi:hypothetical protein